MEMEMTTTIGEVEKEEWEALSGCEPVERRYNWYRAMEGSGLLRLRYLLIREDKTLVAGACSYPFKEKMYIEVPFLEVGVPLALSSAFYFKTPEHIHLLMDGLQKIQKREKTGGILLFGLRKEECDIIKGELREFNHYPVRHNTYIDLDFRDFEDYLSFLDGKARRSVRITLNRARKLEVRHVFTSELSKWSETAHKLQKYTCDQHGDSQWHLPERFYESLETHMRENAELLIFFKEDTPLAFGLSLNSPTTAQYKFVGVDSHFRDYQAYFLIYYEGIRKAIERGQKRIYFGATAYEFKEKIGCKREALYGLVHLQNPLLNAALKTYARYKSSSG